MYLATTAKHNVCDCNSLSSRPPPHSPSLPLFSSPGQGSLHVLAVAGKLQSLQSHPSIAMEAKQISQFH